MTTRVAFIGLDHWYNAFPRLEALTQRTDAEVVALAHRDAARAAEVGARFGVAVLPRYEDVIARDDVDLVCIFTSADETAALSVQALEAGKAVLAIKPMGMDLAQADRVVAAARRSQRPYLSEGMARRFMPVNVQARGWIDEGKIGDLLAVHCVFRAGLPREWPDAEAPGWFADPARIPGGAWLDHAVYHVDVLRWLLGAEVTGVTGMTANVRHRQIPLEDWGHAVLRFANGRMGSIEDTWTSGPGAPKETIEITGSRGSVTFDTATGRLGVSGDFGLGGWLQLNPTPPKVTMLDHVLACARGEAQPAATAEDARAALAACLAFYESARTGREVAPAAPGVPA